MNILTRKIFFRIVVFFALSIFVTSVSFIFSGCRSYDGKIDIVYFFKTEPEKAVIDFIQSIDNKDPQYIYNNLLLNKDKNRISRDKFVEEFQTILANVKGINIEKTVYLGYENDMSKVVAEFEVEYKNGELKQYKKYIYLINENNKWKIVFEKTFI